MSKLYFRNAVLEAKDAATGIVRLSFASELPVLRKDKRGKFYEVLSHAPGDANLGLLNRAGMVLENHDETKEIGDVVKASAKVDADKKTRADIQIFDGQWLTRAKATPATIPVSVGYNHLSELREEPAGDDGFPTRVYSWRPYEISLLTVAPADDTVGINRSKTKRRCADCEGSGRCRCRKSDDDKADNDCEDCGGDGDCAGCDGDGYFESARSNPVDLENLTEEQIARLKEKFMPEETKIEITKADEQRKAAVIASETAERTRANEITIAADAFIDKHGKKNDGKCAGEIRAFANEAIEKGHAADSFNARSMQHILNAKEVPLTRDFVQDEIPDKDAAQFSFMRAVQQAVESRAAGGNGMPDDKTVEGAVVKAYREKVSKEGGLPFTPQGFIIPPGAQIGSVGLTRNEMLVEHRKMQNRYGSSYKRDMQATIFGAGGAAVPTYWLLPYIDLLRNKIVLSRLGMTVMAGLTGNVIIPRLEGPSTAYSVAEIAALTQSQQTIGQVAMSPHRVGNSVNISKQLIFQSSPDAEALVTKDMFDVMAIKADYLGLNGQGSASEPLGIFNTPGIGAVTFGATPTYIKMVNFETQIRNLNVRDILAYASTSATKGSLKTVAEALTGATTIGGAQNAIWHKGVGGTGEDDGEVNGYKAVDSQQIPNNLVLAGAFNNFLMGMWAGLDVVVNPYSLDLQAEYRITMTMWIDYAMRHPQAFCASTDAGNQ